MKNNIQNIFMDMKSYELIQNMLTKDELVQFILKNVNPLNVQTLYIKGFLFQVEYRPHNPSLTFVFTVDTCHTIEIYKNNFKKSIYLYNLEALMSYDNDFCCMEYLLYTNKATIVVIPYQESGLSIMDCSTGELIQRL